MLHKSWVLPASSDTSVLNPHWWFQGGSSTEGPCRLYIKNAIYLSLVIMIQVPSALKREHSALQSMKFLFFIFLWVIFFPPGTGFGFWIRIHWPDWIQSGSGSETPSGFVTFWDGDGSLDPLTGLRIRIWIMLFSSVAFKMITSNKFFYLSLFAYYFLWGHLHQSSKITSHLEVIQQLKSRFLNFLLVDGRIRTLIRTNITDPDPGCSKTYAFGSGSKTQWFLGGLPVSRHLLLWEEEGGPGEGGGAGRGRVIYFKFYN